MTDAHPSLPTPGESPVPGAGQSPAGQPEYLQQGAGTPVPPAAPSGGGRKGLFIGGAVVGGLALAGAGAWAAVTLAGGGPQPTEALPADTLAYLSVDLDPSAGQKIEAMKMLNKFPSFDEELGIDPTDDLRKVLFDEAFEANPCEGMTYDDDIAPWIGDRAAVAAVNDSDGKPGPVLVIQVTDEGKAAEGLKALAACGDSSEDSGYVVQDGWAVMTEDTDLAQAVADSAADSSLADDETYLKWMDEVGDPGFVNMYVAPSGLQALYDATGDQAAELAAIDVGGSLADFKGMAATIRFNDGALELEGVGASADEFAGGAAAGELAASLPADTAGAISVSVPDGWVESVADRLAGLQGDDVTGAELLDDMSEQTGLDLPADLETLTGEAIALSMSSDIDLDAMANANDMSEVPVGVKIMGDAEAIQEVLDKLAPQLGGAAELLTAESDGDMVALSPHDGYRAALIEDGGLGDEASFSDAVPEGEDSTMVVFLNFDAGDGWLDQLAESDPSAAENVEPLDSLGMSAWIEDDTTHVVLKLTTD